MNKLTKPQQDQLAALAIGAVGIIGALWYFGVSAKQHELAVTRDKSAKLEKQVHEGETLMRRGDEIGEALQTKSDLLTKREATLTPDRDSYAWLINAMNTFLQSHTNINIDTYSQPEISDTGIIPRFPYRWATFHLKGSGYYQDIGKFFAEVENAYPYYRIQDVNLSPNTGPATEPEKLGVTFDIVAPMVTSSP